ncbi:hypothetical protein EDC01DRAFT_190470 [Geopyxis carbonaria]|nr:hypothetical protein EDC01DRAFT_190470 [Geopyxis carbonaria]
MPATNHNYEQVIAWYICTAVAFLFVALRFWIRLTRFRQLLLDDYLLVGALACLIIDLAIQHHMWNHNMAVPSAASFADFQEMMRCIPPGSSIYILSLWLIKLSLVYFYKRLATRTNLQRMYNVAAAILVATGTFLVLLIVFGCWPVSKRWGNPAAGEAVCPKWLDPALYWLMVLLNIGTDVMVLVLPWSMVFSLRLPLRQKIGLGGVFTLGVFVICASIVRAVLSRRNETMLTCTVSMIETSIAIVATCLPAVRTLVMKDRTQTSGYELSGRDMPAAREMKKPSAVDVNGSDEELVTSMHGRIVVTRDYLVSQEERGMGPPLQNTGLRGA